MNRKIAGTIAGAVVLMLALPGALLAHDEGKIPAGTKVLWPASDIKWGPMTGLEGAQQAPLWGDPTKGPHGILYKWKAGLAAPLHTHTHGDRGVVVSGTLTLAVESGAPKDFPSGSYFSMSGGVKHATACKAGAECVFFIYRDGPFDVHMVEAAQAGKAPKQ